MKSRTTTRGKNSGHKKLSLYRLRYVLRAPSEATEDKYLAEAPDLPGCRAWGATAAEALENLQGVASAFLDSYQERGDPLPPQMAKNVIVTTKPATTSEMLVAV
jgi:predicted RNase H-like HicB family nuclease